MSDPDSSPIIGIDLGTTNSLVGVVDSGFPILLADEQGRRILPSAVHIPERGHLLVGHPALRMKALEPHRTITSIKRFMGRRYDEADPAGISYRLGQDKEGRLLVDLKERVLSPEEVSAEILRVLRQTAEDALETEVSRAVITVPAYFNDAQRNATKRAGELAGLTVERIVSEPTAAALAYGLNRLDEKSHIAVYDFGGGTFDISILELNEGVFQVVSTTGDTHLGGDDLDEAIANWIENQISGTIDGEARVRIGQAARKAKEDLSQKEEVEIVLPFLGGAGGTALTLTREEFHRMAGPIVERTRPHCRQALRDAGISDPANQLNRIILVGGSTRIPLVRELVEEVFGQAPDTSQNPEEAVALGATIQAGILSGALRNIVLLDVTPLSLGIETYGGLMNVIIPRNSTIPCKAGELFTNGAANQQSMLIRVLQGEREMARDNWELGEFVVDFTSGPRGSARVGVEFAIDENGILRILARDTATNTDRVLEIQNSAVNVEDEQVERMISESVDFAFEDMNERIWTEARMKSEELLPSVEIALRQIGDAVEPAEIQRIQSAADRVRTLLESSNPDAKELKQANRELDESTEHLAAILVERAMEKRFG